jgi:hypothetical protein
MQQANECPVVRNGTQSHDRVSGMQVILQELSKNWHMHHSNTEDRAHVSNIMKKNVTSNAVNFDSESGYLLYRFVLLKYFVI